MSPERRSVEPGAFSGFGICASAAGLSDGTLRADFVAIRLKECPYEIAEVRDQGCLHSWKHSLHPNVPRETNHPVGSESFRCEPRARPLLKQVPLVVMPILSRTKKDVGKKLGSAAMNADAKQTDFCVYLSGVLLAGLLLNAALGCGGQTRRRR